jgi:hypothetical protein
MFAHRMRRVNGMLHMPEPYWPCCRRCKRAYRQRVNMGEIEILFTTFSLECFLFVRTHTYDRLVAGTSWFGTHPRSFSQAVKCSQSIIDPVAKTSRPTEMFYYVQIIRKLLICTRRPDIHTRLADSVFRSCCFVLDRNESTSDVFTRYCRPRSMRLISLCAVGF